MKQHHGDTLETAKLGGQTEHLGEWGKGRQEWRRGRRYWVSPTLIKYLRQN